MSEVATYQFPATGQEIRILMRGEDPIFCLTDVCRGLQHSNPSVARHLVDEDDRVEIDLRETDSPNLNRTSINPKIWFVTESGFYTLAMTSQAPGAKIFRRWVTHDVLPALRKTGRYESTPGPKLPTSYAEALRELAAQVEAGEQVKAQLAEAAPKAHSWDVLASADGDYAVADAAKILSRDPAIKLGRGRLFTTLDDLDWIYRQRADGRWRVKQHVVDRGWLSEIPASHYHPRTGELVLDAPQVRISAKGLAELHRRLGGTSPLQAHHQLALAGQ